MDSNESGENKPFLAEIEEGLDNDNRSTTTKVFPWSKILRTHGILFVGHIVLLTLNFGVFLWGTMSTISCTMNDFESDAFEKAFSPAHAAVRYTVEEITPESWQSSFIGKPRLEVDRAWSNLLRSSMVKITEDELRRMNKTSIELRDGTGYIGYLESHHMLHCVKRMYQFKHPEEYTELRGTGLFTDEHYEHCLEVLRQGIMCNADMKINTYYWEGPNEPKGDWFGPRKCTDWNMVQAWADERAINFKGNDDALAKLVPSNELGSFGPANLLG